MVLGILMKGVNNIHFRDPIAFFFEFLPQLVFMLASFGYMVFCIIFKWFQDYSEDPDKAPSIISLFINFVSIEGPPLYKREV